jgi:hypothetical protein
MLGLALLMGTSTGKSAKTADEVRAKRFILIDEDGRQRAMLGIETIMDNPQAPGSTVLRFYDEKGQSRLSHSLAPGGSASMGIMSVDGRSKALLIGGTDIQRIGFFDKNGSALAQLAVGADGSSNLLLRDSTGVRAALDVEADGSPALRLYDTNGKTRVVLGATTLKDGQKEIVEQRPASSLVLLDKNEKVLWKVP